MNKEQLILALEKVRAQNPLVHNITNVVVTNFTANGAGDRRFSGYGVCKGRGCGYGENIRRARFKYWHIIS